MRTFVSISLMFLFLQPFHAAGQEQKDIEVIAEGFSYLGDNNSIKESREKVLVEVERMAIEQGSTTYLESYTQF